MKRAHIVQAIEQEKIIAIVRLKHQSEVQGIVESLIAGGISILEITSNTPGYLESIRICRELFPDIIIGAGTIINTQMAKEALAAGAQFIVTPNTNTDVIHVCHEHDVAVLMGAFTPSEVSLAADHGADFVKLFPANILGTQYLKSIKGPFDKVKFIAVGGISLENLQEWLSAGVCGVGVGSVLTHTQSQNNKDETTKQMAQSFVSKVKN